MTYPYKICDSVHGFIRFNEIEQQVIDSLPFQRLRYLYQMGVAYLVYPGATHTRFEHSLGVMELAGRIYNTLVNQASALPINAKEISYWRQILRLAALCHDMGHLPFSHTAEKALLPQGGHEKKTLEIIQSEPMLRIWSHVGPNAMEDIIKLCLNEKEIQELGTGLELNEWERMLSQVITEDNFGADRIDYLIRDAKHTGVGYGFFDYHQLIDTLRILSHDHLRLGIQASGIQSVESLWIARYMMYARVYHHPKARVYTKHMNRFMCDHYQERGFPPTLSLYLKEADFTILHALHQKGDEGNYDALALLKREKPYQEILMPPTTSGTELLSLFNEKVFLDNENQKIGSRTFFVLTDDGKIVTSCEFSTFLRDIPPGGKPLRLFVHPDHSQPVKNWLRT